MNDYFDCMRHYAVFAGRLSRGGYWSFIAAVLLLTAVGVFIDYSLGLPVFLVGRPGWATITVLVGHFLPFVASSVRRIHDSDQTGWLYWLIYIPVLGWIPFLGLMLARGTAGSNRYGVPYEPSEGTAPMTFGSYEQVPPSFSVVPAQPTPRQPTPVSASTPVTRPSRPNAASPAGKVDTLGQLERLAALKASGAIDDAEFTAMKASVIASTSESNK